MSAATPHPVADSEQTTGPVRRVCGEDKVPGIPDTNSRCYIAGVAHRASPAIGQIMVANRTLKVKAREYAEDFDVPYPRALADLTAPGLVVPLHSKSEHSRFGFDPLSEGHLILTGDLDTRAGFLERVFGRFSFKPEVAPYFIDVTGDLTLAFSNLAKDGSEGAALTTTAAASLLREVLSHVQDPSAAPDGRNYFTLLAINGLPELLAASDECHALLVQLLSLDSPELSFVLAGEWIGSVPFPGGPFIRRATRLHHGSLGDLHGFASKRREKWLALSPEPHEGIYHRQGFKPELISFNRPAGEPIERLQ